VFLGFDFGTQCIGVAVGQLVTQTAQPLAALRAKRGQVRWPAVDALVETWKPEAFIVGLPMNMDGSRQWITDAAEQFMQALSSRYTIPVHPMDERLSTVEARQQLFEQYGYRGLAKEQVDSMAATLIVESWLAKESAGR